ncbi:hypothetical protein B0T26DRAFT_717426 [Lasiosphaeria miniovina]|uniref:Xylanolytic transcriptional activator regulatory domain-containing protein n=1 Tax=Lasiosphaeria miniovina TaxID=1954250 RepID=A0AA40ACQ8_9PEZI|nr:uncharacterized protein B0T26DRAFT_717426 [Lasiosphaeria miniovina]KAK0713430.1 hypothetical protein B0T26DRAFT_717426 [Lasiosphaeria miniovina]
MRCDGQSPTCSACSDRGHVCAYPATQKIRGPGKSKQRIEALEARLAKMESKFRHESTKDSSSDDTVPRSLKEPQSVAHAGPPRIDHIDAGPLSVLSDVVFPFHRQISQRFTLWQGEECTKRLERTALSPLTAETPELWVAERFLNEVCAELPFLHTPWFVDRIKHPDAANNPDAGWQGVMNAIIASTVHFKTLNSSFREVAVYSWCFFRNAYAMLPELIVHGDGLGAAQAVMAMALFMRQSADTRTTSRLLSMAVHMQQSASPRVMTAAYRIPSPDERENQSRLFWTTFVLDMEMTINTGLPPVHHHAEQGVTADLPIELGQRNMVFRLRAELARIQQRIGTVVQLNTHKLPDLFALESEVEAWCLRVPLEFRPRWFSDQLESASSNESPMDVSVAMLHLVYYNSLSLVSWVSVRHTTAEMLPVESPRDIDSINKRTSRHKSVSRAAARATIRSMSRFPTQSFTELWRALCYPVAASIALLAVICKEPTHAEAQGDLSLLSWFVGFLNRMVRDEGCDLERMRDGVSKFEKVAADAVGMALASAMPVNPALWPLSIASGHTSKVST